MNISIVIPNYNGAKYILECIKSVYDQVDIKREIIVVDNNSNDESLNLIKRHYADISLLINESNFGFAKAVNQGIRYSNADFVILLNNDAFARPGFVQSLLNCINSDSKIFSVSAKMLSYSNPELIDNAGDQLCLTGWAFKTGDGKHHSLFNEEKTIFSSCAGAAIYRKSVFHEIGFFDEVFFAYLEDVDVGFRANIFGYKNVFCPAAEVLHIGSATSGSKYNDFKIKISARNNIYMLYKNLPNSLLILLGAFIIMGCIVKLIFFWRIGFGKSYAGGLKDAFKELKLIDRIKYRNQNLRSYVRIFKMLFRSTIYYFSGRLLQ